LTDEENKTAVGKAAAEKTSQKDVTQSQAAAGTDADKTSQGTVYLTVLLQKVLRYAACSNLEQ